MQQEVEEARLLVQALVIKETEVSQEQIKPALEKIDAASQEAVTAPA